MNLFIYSRARLNYHVIALQTVIFLARTKLLLVRGVRAPLLGYEPNSFFSLPYLSPSERSLF